MIRRFFSRIWSKERSPIRFVDSTRLRAVPSTIVLKEHSLYLKVVEDQARKLLRSGEAVEALLVLEAIPFFQHENTTWGLKAEAYALMHDWPAFQALTEQAIEQTSDPAVMHTLLGEICFEFKNFDSALDLLHVAVELDRSQTRAWLMLGDVYSKKNSPLEALYYYQEALEFASVALKPAVLFQLGQAYHSLHDFDKAKAVYVDLLDIAPDHALGWMALGHIELLEDHANEALASYERASGLTTSPPFALNLHIGIALRFLGRWDEALNSFKMCVQERPNDQTAQWYLCQCLLALERWEEGWALYGLGRFASGTLKTRPMPFPSWSGAPIPGRTLLLLAEQGLGDEIMFASCISDAIQHSCAGRVLIECDPRLSAIIERSFPSVRAVPSTRRLDGQWLPTDEKVDFQFRMGDLPALYRRQPEDFPLHSGYLKVDSTMTGAWEERLASRAHGRLRIGISWRGGTALTRQKIRSLSPKDLLPILSNPGYYFISLQYGEVDSDLIEFRNQHGCEIDHFPDLIPDYDATAAAIKCLDMVVTVCTSLVHLAGAIHAPAFVLTPFSPEWRYTAHERRMLWYPTVRLYRQTAAGDWSEAIQNLLHEIKDRQFLSPSDAK